MLILTDAMLTHIERSLPHLRLRRQHDFWFPARRLALTTRWTSIWSLYSGARKGRVWLRLNPEDPRQLDITIHQTWGSALLVADGTPSRLAQRGVFNATTATVATSLIRYFRFVTNPMLAAAPYIDLDTVIKIKC